MTEQELKEKIEIYNHFLKEGNKSSSGTDLYTEMIEQVEIELLDLQN